MILLASIILGLALGWAAGGSPRELRNEQMTGKGLLLTVLVFQAGLPVAARSLPAVTEYVFSMWVMSFVALVLLALLNVRKTGFPAIAIGTSLNLVAIMANGGMPVSVRSMVAAGYSGTPNLSQVFSLLYHPMTPKTVMPIIADVMPLPGPGWVESVVSVGDVLLAVGVTVFIAAAMRPDTFSGPGPHSS